MEYKINYKTVTLILADNQGEINQPKAAYDLITGDPEYDPTVEQMWLIAMNIKNEVHLKHLLVKGGYNAIFITPADIFVPCLRLNLRHFILAHNHPSNDIEPSDEDIVFTKKIKKAAKIMGISFLDHVIIAGEKYYSFKANGLI